jgi:acyl carrier protein
MENKLIQIFNTVLSNRGRKEINKLPPDTDLKNDIGFDSLDLAELTVRIEAEYGIDIFEKGIIRKVGEILEKLYLN